MSRTDRTVHASTEQWEIVRYDRSSKWFAEWIGGGKPQTHLGPEYLAMKVNRAGRAPLTVRQAATAAVGLGATHHAQRPGGATFDRMVHRDTEDHG